MRFPFFDRNDNMFIQCKQNFVHIVNVRVASFTYETDLFKLKYFRIKCQYTKRNNTINIGRNKVLEINMIYMDIAIKRGKIYCYSLSSQFGVSPNVYDVKFVIVLPTRSAPWGTSKSGDKEPGWSYHVKPPSDSRRDGTSIIFRLKLFRVAHVYVVNIWDECYVVRGFLIRIQSVIIFPLTFDSCNKDRGTCTIFHLSQKQPWYFYSYDPVFDGRAELAVTYKFTNMMNSIEFIFKLYPEIKKHKVT